MILFPTYDTDIMLSILDVVTTKNILNLVPLLEHCPFKVHCMDPCYMPLVALADWCRRSLGWYARAMLHA